ncbi:uncharacterized protein Dvir_GJ22765 [Drosophila virilis]|uniref:Uncharacterized protein n=1 Tax=Drosophila virilis TaxID=7244 RepID=B4LYL5_DROVI|nr:uncharacterized protein LOC6629495 [Drosophila virilis]EDW68035.1 uncharacterized protein Dvir_GJ22765 [Drosophila virilis]
MAETPDVTPRPRRRLGLRLHKRADTTPGIRLQKTQRTATLLSEDEKNENSADAVETPRALPGKLKANSTICRRPGLPRKRKDLTKKRLQFATADTSELAPKKADPKPSEATANAHLNNWRQRQILELEADIETWKNGFVAAMDDLQALVVPRVAKKTLLTQLGIPLEMLKYLDQD